MPEHAHMLEPLTPNNAKPPFSPPGRVRVFLPEIKDTKEQE